MLDPDRVVVAVPTLDEERHIRNCLLSIIGDDPAMRTVRIVVADGGSADGTRRIVRDVAAAHPNVTLLDNPGRLQSAAVNAVAFGPEGARREILVRCDAHAAYPPRYVLDVAARLDALPPDVAAVATVMDATGEGCFQRAAAWIVDTPLGSGGAAHRGGRRSGYVDHGHHAGFRLSWFRRVGGYDPSFSHNEDAELDHRFAEAGGRVWLAADIRLAYAMRGSLAGLARQYHNYGRGRARTQAKHGARPRLRQMLPAVNLAAQAACLAAAPAEPWLVAAPAGYLAAATAVSLAGAAGLRSPCGLWAGPAMLAIHNAWAVGYLRQRLAGRGRPAR
jgi:succinoglycan biosynthesis protein ExoA